MKKISKKDLQFLRWMLSRFNEYSELVALNHKHIKEGKADDSILQWNRGNLNAIEEMVRTFAKQNDVALIWECGEHPFLDFTLEYITVREEGTQKPLFYLNCNL